VTLAFDLLTLVLAGNVSRGTVNLHAISVLMRLFSVELWANTRQSNDLWTLRLPRMWVMRVVDDRTRRPTPSVCSVYQVGTIPRIWLISGHGVKQPSDLDLWHFDLGTGAQCQPWHDQPSGHFWCFCDFSLSSYGQICVRLTTWLNYLNLWGHRICQ